MKTGRGAERRVPFSLSSNARLRRAERNDSALARLDYFASLAATTAGLAATSHLPSSQHGFSPVVLTSVTSRPVAGPVLPASAALALNVKFTGLSALPPLTVTFCGSDSLYF